MCVAFMAGPEIPGISKPISRVVNNSPIGLVYKQASGGERYGDSLKSGNAYAGLAGGAIANRIKKSNQFSTAGAA